ncbi:hypothetical protein [Teredinibacter franksiae]|uniref:hypothetical protein n=1 Tax=Teredinibacter franksiae TaxID=2761453 RepID=UPI0016237C63|nr:hypothetical protein [Teredinibacter franksiae]
MNIAASSHAPSQYLSNMQWARNYILVYLDEDYRDPNKNAKYKEYTDHMESALTIAKQGDDDFFELLTLFLKLVINDSPERYEIRNLSYYCDELKKTVRHIKPKQAFKDAMELNILWGTRNSIIYSLAIILYANGVTTKDTSSQKDLLNNFITLFEKTIQSAQPDFSFNSQMTNSVKLDEQKGFVEQFKEIFSEQLNELTNAQQEEIVNKINSLLTVFLDSIYNLFFIKPLHADPIPSCIDGYTIEKLEQIVECTDKTSVGMTLPASASST